MLEVLEKVMVQKVAEYAKMNLGIQYMLFSVGGNVCAIGGHPDGSAWAVGIQNPDVESDQAYIKKWKFRI